MDKETILKRFQTVYDPEHPVSILDLKIVTAEDISVEDKAISVTFTPTTPFCPMGAVIGVVIKKVLQDMAPEAAVTVKVKEGSHVREPMVNQMINEPAQYERTLNNLKENGMLEQCVGPSM